MSLTSIFHVNNILNTSIVNIHFLYYQSQHIYIFNIDNILNINSANILFNVNNILNPIDAILIS